MKVTTKKGVIKLIAFILIGFILLNIITVILLPEWVDNHDVTLNIRGLYNERKNSIDVVFLGDSNVFMGVSPMILWKNSGITGYAYSSSDQNLVLSYYLLKEFFKYQKPKVVVLDVDKAFDESDMLEADKRKVIDNIKFSKNKLELINDKSLKMSTFDKMSCVFPILRYHTRWNRLGLGDFRRVFNKYDAVYKGYCATDKVKSYNRKVDYMEKRDNSYITSNSKEYLEKIIGLCKRNNSNLLLMKVPCMTTWSLEKHTDMQNFADEHNLKFIDINFQNVASIDWNADSEDGGLHLNIYGAEKTTNYINSFLKNNYLLKDHRSDLKYSNWNDDLKNYEEGIKKTKEEIG